MRLVHAYAARSPSVSSRPSQASAATGTTSDRSDRTRPPRRIQAARASQRPPVGAASAALGLSERRGRSLLLLCLLLVLPALAGLLVLQAARLGLLLKHLVAGLLLLGHVDVLHEHALVLEHVTPRLHVELVVEVLVDLLLLPVLLEEAPEHALPPDPQHLGGHARLARAAALAVARVAALADRLKVLQAPRAGVHLLRLLDDEAVLDEFADVLAGVGHGDVIGLVGVQPDLALAALEHGRSQPLLHAQVDAHRLAREGRGALSPAT
mmetsp:Transcript_704/g.2162  ORF Transcript_704/g.2162 Transcript_704/m.2162 type:complete len:267 (-) Transcript_704:9-809(-)